jgi:hypothetical protein
MAEIDNKYAPEEMTLGGRTKRSDEGGRESAKSASATPGGPLLPNYRKDSFLYVTALYSVFFLFLTLTFPAYFYFAPDLSEPDVRPTLLILYLITWPLAVFVPVILLWVRNITAWNAVMSTLYLVTVLGWPLVTILIKIRSLVTNGDAGIGYWGTYPVFIALEILWAVLAVTVWAVKRRSMSVKAQIRREMNVAMKEEFKKRTEKTF